MENPISTYPIYEDSQLLSNTQLNGSFNYLENQIRITRTDLIATGTLSGLDYSISGNAISIKKGTAVTSLGFQIQWAEKTFTHSRNIELPKNFLAPVLPEDNPVLKKLFTENIGIYQNIKQSIELIDGSVIDNTKTVLSPNTWSGKVVLLLFELKLKNASNCDANSCDDKGADIIVDVRPLLISKEQAAALDNNNVSLFVSAAGESICMPRFNIPKTNLVNKNDIFKAYESLYSSGIVPRLGVELNKIITQLTPAFSDLAGWSSLKNINNTLHSTVAQQKTGIYCQYLYNWLFDIVQTYNELCGLDKITNPKANTAYFPFHVLLGNEQKQHRTGYYPAPHLAQTQNENFEKAEILLKRLIHLLNNFNISSSTIKITPSQLGSKELGQCAIPFYYKEQIGLSQVWSKSKNASKEPLGYWSDSYSKKYCVTEALKCNLDTHNFYRVEGHIGKNYQQALQELELLRESYRLPFKVIALNAISIQGRTLGFGNTDFNYKDLEVNYDIARTKITKIGRDITGWINQNSKELNDLGIFNLQNTKELTRLVNACIELFTEDLGSFLSNYTKFTKVFDDINFIYLFHRNCILKNIFKDGNTTNDFQAEDLIDHLDQLNTLFLEDPFSVIYKEAKIRYENSVRKTLFEYFYQHQAGIEPQNGVSKGGTFILVYTDNSIFTDLPKSTNPVWEKSINNIGFYKDGLMVSEEQNLAIKTQINQKYILSNTEIDRANVAEKLSKNSKCVEEIGDLAFDKMTETIKTKLPLAHQNLFLEHWLSLKGKLNVLETIDNSEGLVFADFCLPYICCGDGDAINLVLPSKPAVIPQISMAKTAFCSDSLEKIEVLLLPNGIQGSFNNGAIIKENGKYFYQSKNTASQETLFFSSAENQNSNVIQINTTVSRTSNLVISNSRGTATDREVFFTVTNLLATESYDVDFGDGSPKQTFSANIFHHVFPNITSNKTYTLLITSRINGLCPHTTTTSITVKADIIPFLKIDQTEFCWTEDKKYCIKTDENFKMSLLSNAQGLIFEGNTPCFIPRRQDMSQTKIFQLNYAGESINITIKKANADFELLNNQPVPIQEETMRTTAFAQTGFVVKAEDQNADFYQWSWNPNDFDTLNEILKSQMNQKEILIPYSIIREIGKINFSLVSAYRICDDKAEMTKTVIFNPQTKQVTFK